MQYLRVPSKVLYGKPSLQPFSTSCIYSRQLLLHHLRVTSSHGLVSVSCSADVNLHSSEDLNRYKVFYGTENTSKYIFHRCHSDFGGFGGNLNCFRRLNLNNNGAIASWTNFSTSSKYLKNSKDSEKQSRLNEEHQNNDTTEDVSSDKKETETTKDGAFARFKDLIKKFGNGCKQLMWIDARKAWATKKKLKRHDYDLTILTREELRHMRQTKKDMIKSLPVALLFFLPFIGYFAPVIGFLFPKRLLSHQFWDLEQRKKFAFEDHVKRSQYYLPLIQEVGWSSKELDNEDLFQLCIKAINGNHITNDDLISQKDIFLNDLMTVEKMPRFHLEKLCKIWLLPVKWYIPSKVLREFLISRIKQIIEDDDAIRRDKIDSLSDICIRQACHARGLDKSSFDVHVMKNWLNDWMCLTHRFEDGNLSLFAHCAVFKTINFGKTLKEKSS